MRVFDGLDDLRAHVGTTLGTSAWVDVSQERIDTFAEATGDHQWIHVDPERAAAGPFGVTIAHGYLTLSLLPALVASIYRVDGLRMAVNYGMNRVRFPAPVRVDARVRATTDLTTVREVPGGLEIELTSTVEIEGSEKPGCVAQTVARYYA